MTLKDDPELAASFEALAGILDHRPVPPPPIPAAPTPFVWWPWAAGGGGVAVVVIAWMAWPADVPSVGVAAIEPIPPAVVAESPAILPLPEAPPAAAPAPLGPRPRPIATPSAAPSQAPADVPAPPEPAVPPPAAEVLAPAPGTLEEEERLYRPAHDALEAGQWDVALSAADAYLRAYPNGRWVDKVWLLQVDALVGAARWREAAALAVDLTERPPLAPRRAHLLRIAGESLAAAGDCAGALRIADRLERADAAPIRRACR